MPDTAAPGPRVVAVIGRGVIAPDAAVVTADDAGVTRGDGCFEGCRLRVDDTGTPVVDKLDAHLARMTRSAASLDIAFDESSWRPLIAEAAAHFAAAGGRGEAALKLVLTRGRPGGSPTGFLTITPMSPDYQRLRREGIRVITLDRGFPSTAFQDAPWLLAGVKTLSYAINMAAAREAERRGADDVVFVASDGIVLEAPTASVVWWDGACLHTTPLGDTGILAGTTQELLFANAAAAGWRTARTRATVADLHDAEGLWLISSVRGPVEIVELDGKQRARSPELDAQLRDLCGF